MNRKTFSYRIVYPYAGKINTRSDFIDVEVKLEGVNYRGSLTTPTFIEEKLREYLKTGENGEGSYFCAKGMVVLRDLSQRTIKKSLADLIERGDLGEFFIT